MKISFYKNGSIVTIDGEFTPIDNKIKFKKDERSIEKAEAKMKEK